jgi:hypothetical protein
LNLFGYFIKDTLNRLLKSIKDESEDLFELIEIEKLEINVNQLISKNTNKALFLENINAFYYEDKFKGIIISFIFIFLFCFNFLISRLRARV